MDYYDLTSGGIVAAQRETGFDPISMVAQAGYGIADLIAGGPQKRERMMREQTKQAELAAQVAQAQAATELEMAKLQYAAQAQGAGGGGGGILSHKIAGIPTVALAAGAAIAAFLLLRK